MTQDEMNEAMGQRHAFHTSALLGEQAAMAISLRAQLDVAQLAQGELQAELAKTKGLLEAAEAQVAQSGAEIEALKAKYAATTEGKDEALQASADEASARAA